MIEGRSRDDWAHTAALMAQQANIYRDPKKKSTPFSPNDFDPWVYLDRKRKGRRADDRLPGDIKMLKTVFVDRKTQ